MCTKEEFARLRDLTRENTKAEAKRRAEAERRQQEYERAHLPADVAALLAARRAAAVTNETTVVIRQ